MKSLLWVIVLFSLAAGIALVANFNDGYVLLVVPPYRVELSLTLALLLLTGAFLVLYGLLRAIALSRSLPARVRAYRARTQREEMLEAQGHALRLFFEGRYRDSLLKASAWHDTGLQSSAAALVAAASAQRLGESAAQAEWMARAIAAEPRMQAAGQMLEVEALIAQERNDEALVLLERLRSSGIIDLRPEELEGVARRKAGGLLTSRSAATPDN